MKTYVATLDYQTATVHFDTFDGDLSDSEVEERLAETHDLSSIYYMMASYPFDVFSGNKDITLSI